MRDIAIVAYHQSACVSDAGAANEVELIMPVLAEVYRQVGINNAQDVDFVCSGSCDYLQGAAFAFVAPRPPSWTMPNSDAYDELTCPVQQTCRPRTTIEKTRCDRSMTV